MNAQPRRGPATFPGAVGRVRPRSPHLAGFADSENLAMADHQFDLLTRSLAERRGEPRSRRALAAAVMGVILAPAFGVAAGNKSCRLVDQKCGKNNGCCKGARCKKGRCRCK